MAATIAVTVPLGETKLAAPLKASTLLEGELVPEVAVAGLFVLFWTKA